jgi:tetratricopeptide (TPR) repeat protein
LSSAPKDHLNPATLQAYADGAADPTALAEEHLRACSACRDRLQEVLLQQNKLDSLKFWKSRGPASECPPRDVWWKIAPPSSDESLQLLAHAAQCACCAALLREATEDASADTSPYEEDANRLTSSTQSGMRRTADLLARSVRPTARPFYLRTPVWVTAAAAIVLVTGVLFMNFNSPARADRLLVTAYTEHRPIELRFLGAAYAPLVQTRGVNPAATLSLREAEAIISKELARHPSEAGWLEEKGRAEILSGDYEQAIVVLNRAREIDPKLPNSTAYLAVAYFERGVATGDRSADQRAAELFSETIAKTPGDPVLRFNRAISYEALGQNDLAISDWKVCESLEKNKEWAAEARSHLADLERRKASHTGH